MENQRSSYSGLLECLKLMRVHHWLKNGLIFLPIVFGRKLFDLHYFVLAAAGGVAFSLLSSVIYIINDINDRERDRTHPLKCKRPLASGTITIKSAYILSAFLVLSVLLIGFFTFKSVWAWVCILVYFVLNLLYSKGLKNVCLVDVFILVSGYLIRVLFGGIVCNIEISEWMALTVIAISFFMGFGKRYGEQNKNIENPRKVLKKYPLGYLEQSMYLCLTLAIVFYSLWCMDAATVLLNDNILWTVIPVIMICMKYTIDIHQDSFADPMDIIIHDKALLIMAFFYAIIMFMFVYLPHVGG